MTNETKDAITKLLFGAMPKADKLGSIEEKRKLYHKYLENNLDFLDVDEPIDENSDEIDELIADQFLNISIERPQIFEAEGYVPWLQDARKNIAWNFYNRYEEYLLTKKGWKPKAISDIKKSSDIILDHMANPKSENLYGKQGLVIGDIQSGKTANYTAVINKAIDAGYKIIIVLAGLTRDLRNQTQKRLDSEVLGYETKTTGKGNTIGVGNIKQFSVEGLTYADDKKDFGDMKKYFSIHTLDKNLNPLVAIVKKNKSVLEHLDKFITSSQSSCYTNDKLDIPVLIIDDEVDQASVDTENGKEIVDASTINKLIRTILGHLNRYSYVGYTATPFANIFVDPDKNDIYPKDFILCLPSNDDYCGIKEYFGVDIQNDSDYVSDHTSDLFVNIDDYDKLFIKGEKINARSQSIALNASVKEAIISFIMAASVKKARGFEGFNSMLIHIARFKNPATTLKPLVETFISELYHSLKYKYNETIVKFEEFWHDKFENISQVRLGEDYKDDWNEIKAFLLPTIESIQMDHILVLNGDSGDILDYSSSKSGDFIVMGGDKLSRGLTLEGLIVSYYYRRSRSYDSLLQMGRWFGYRKGWIDVCRVYTTVAFMNDFITVGKVLQQFKSEIQEMYEMHLNPREVGQRIMYSPNLTPTARNKMRTATKIKVSFSNGVQQIITFDRKFREQNLTLTNKFINSLGEGKIHKNHKVVFRHVTVDKILEYLKKYKDCNGYYGFGHINIENWIKYIENLNESGELNDWTVVLSSLKAPNKQGDNEITIGKYSIYKASRTLRDAGDSSKFKYYTIKTNIDPTDFREFYEEGSQEYSEIDHFDTKKDYLGFDAHHALLSIYIADLFEKQMIDEYDPTTHKRKTIRGKKIEDAISMCAPAIWFPKAKDFENSAIMYYASKDYLRTEQEDDEYDDFDIEGGN